MVAILLLLREISQNRDVAGHLLRPPFQRFLGFERLFFHRRGHLATPSDDNLELNRDHYFPTFSENPCASRRLISFRFRRSLRRITISLISASNSVTIIDRLMARLPLMSLSSDCRSFYARIRNVLIVPRVDVTVPRHLKLHHQHRDFEQLLHSVSLPVSASAYRQPTKRSYDACGWAVYHE